MSVLILSESGTDKEHIAEKIHVRNKRASGTFVSLDCGLLSKELAASALFGHEKGAFTGADGRKQGFWKEAAGGTLFLDEIGNLPIEVQQILLRALESKWYRPMGATRIRRLTCASLPPPMRTYRPPSLKSVSVPTCTSG